MTNVCPTYKGPTAEGGREEGVAWAWQQGVRAKAENELPRGRQGVRRAAAAAALAACGGGSERAGARSGATRSMPRRLGSSCLLCSRHAQRGTALTTSMSPPMWQQKMSCGSRSPSHPSPRNVFRSTESAACGRGTKKAISQMVSLLLRPSSLPQKGFQQSRAAMRTAMRGPARLNTGAPSRAPPPSAAAAAPASSIPTNPNPTQSQGHPTLLEQCASISLSHAFLRS